MRVINSTFRGIFDRPEKFLQRVDSEKNSTDRSQNHNTNFLRRAFSRKLRRILRVQNLRTIFVASHYSIRPRGVDNIYNAQNPIVDS